MTHDRVQVPVARLFSKDAFRDVLLASEVHCKNDVSAGSVAEVSAWSWKCVEGLNCALQTPPGLGFVGGS